MRLFSSTIAVVVAVAIHAPSNDIKPQPLNPKAVECLARVVYHEARGEPIQGQIAVAYSVVNRKQDNRFPDTACDVVYQPKQYSNIEKAKFDKSGQEWANSYTVARKVYLRKVKDPTNGAKFYYNPKKANPNWRHYAEGHVVTIGNHKFIENVRNK